MCFFDQHRYVCDDWIWGQFRQHCAKENRAGETCGKKLIFQIVNTATFCNLCDKMLTLARRRTAEYDKVGRWQREPPHKCVALIEKSRKMIRSLTARMDELSIERTRRSAARSRHPSEFTDSARFAIQQKRPVYKALPFTFETPSGPATVLAVPDSGSERNVISRDLALHLGFKILRTGCQDHTLTCIDGGTVCSTGKVEAFCRFARTFYTEPRRIHCVFQVLDSVISPLIMSAAFLETTETMTKYPRRLIERTHNAMQIPKVCALGHMRQRLHCLIDGRNSEVLADSGSDVDIMSLDYLIGHGLTHEATDEQVILADGRMKSVYGICVVQLSIGKVERMLKSGVGAYAHRYGQFPRVLSSSSYARAELLEVGRVIRFIESRFYVLEGIDVDVLIGASSLESLKAFSHHQDAFFRPEIESQHPALHHISLTERARKLARKLNVAGNSELPDEVRPSAQEQLSRADQRENAQRESADATSAKLSGEAKIEFDKKEEARRRDYDSYRTQLLSMLLGSP